MTIQIEALEDGIMLIQTARRSVQWISADNPVWLTLHHAEQYLALQFKWEFNDYFNHNEEEK